jgi:hypothetical protein
MSAVIVIRNKIIRAFVNANVFSEAEAKNIEGLGLQHYVGRGVFKRMVQRGNIIETADGRFYLNRTYYDTRVRLRKIVLPILSGIAIGAIILGIIYLCR